MKAFISYAWDTDEHKEWVRRFADELIRNGVDVILDQYDLSLGDDRFAFMESAVRNVDCVLCVCTPNYVERANVREQGVGVETSLITPRLFETYDDKQYIPIIRDRVDGIRPTPDYLASVVYADFTDDREYSNQMEALLRHLHQKPRYRKPDLGTVPDFDGQPRELVFMPFIFMSGSMLAGSGADDIHRFQGICKGLGATIAELRYGIVGCPPHPSRVLASVEAIRGLYQIAPDAPVSDASVTFPLAMEDRVRFAALASAAIFAGGGTGTLEEYSVCRELQITPLIPVAGLNRASAHLADRMLENPREFFNV